MTKANIVRKFIEENPQYKDKKEIARHLTKKFPKEFKDVENARGIVRMVTGANGEGHRMKKPELTKFFYNGFEKWSEENLNTEIEPWDEPFVMPAFKELSVIADLHSVFLDHKVMSLFLRTRKDKEVLLLNGDLLDSSSLSRHLKLHNVVAYEREIELCHQILKGLKQEFTHVYFKEGNHDFWLERYLLTNAREVFRLLGMSLKELLRLGELGIHHIHNLKYIQYGDLDIIHGHEFPGFGTKFPSVSLVDRWQRFKKSYNVKVMQAHSHQSCQTITRKSKTGEFGQGWVMPAMCKKGMHYAPYAGKENGWAELKQVDGVTEVKLMVV